MQKIKKLPIEPKSIETRRELKQVSVDLSRSQDVMRKTANRVGRKFLW
jgi:hypothetical protein